MSKEVEPKIAEITIGISRTFNLGQFESCRVEAQARASLEGLSVEDATEKMLPHLRKALRLAYDDHVSANGKGRNL